MFKKLIFIFTLAATTLAATLVATPTYADTYNNINTGIIAEPTGDTAEIITNLEATDAYDTLPQFAPGEITKITDDHCLYEGDIAIECPAECYGEDGEFLEGCRRKEDGTYTVESTQSESPENSAPADISEASNGSEIAAIFGSIGAGLKSLINSVKTTIENFLADNFNITIDSETWPLIISATALILTIILIIIINLVAHKKARKAIAAADHQDLENGLREL